MGVTVSYFTPNGGKRRYKDFTSRSSAESWVNRMARKGYGNFISTERTVSVGLNWNKGRPPKPLVGRDGLSLTTPPANLFPTPSEDLARHMWFDPIEMGR